MQAKHLFETKRSKCDLNVCVIVKKENFDNHSKATLWIGTSISLLENAGQFSTLCLTVSNSLLASWAQVSFMIQSGATLNLAAIVIEW